MRVCMRIGIGRCDNKYQEAQSADSEWITAVVFAVSPACYMDRRPALRILCGSI